VQVATRWGWPGITAHVHYGRSTESLLDAGDGRESPLTYTEMEARRCVRASWGWPGITAHVHFCGRYRGHRSGWGWPGITAHVHWYLSSAQTRSSWGWPGITAHVHCVQYVYSIMLAGDGRESPLTYTGRNGGKPTTVLGMAGNHRSRTLILKGTRMNVALGMAGNHRSRTLTL